MDDFQTPKPHEAASKPTVSAVLTWLANSGETLLHLLAGLLAGVMILYSGYVLYDSSYTRNQAFASSWELLKYKPEIISDGAEPTSGGATLAEINKDYRAWITMYDTMIDYPVMQGENDYFYGNHDVYGEASLTGSIYMAAGNTRDLSDDYNLLYGHHMDNGAMFGALDKYRTRSFFDAHRDGVLVGASGVYDLHVFAVAETDAYEDEIYLVGPHRDPQHIIDLLRTGSATTNTLFFDEQAVQGAERVTALSTCADAVTNGRLVVFCVATRRNLQRAEKKVEALEEELRQMTAQRDSLQGSVEFAKTRLADLRVMCRQQAEGQERTAAMLDRIVADFDAGAQAGEESVTVI